MFSDLTFLVWFRKLFGTLLCEQPSSHPIIKEKQVFVFQAMHGLRVGFDMQTK